MRPVPAALAIAGSDPSGGAGIQADLKTFTVLGVYGCAAITCLTVQNTKGVAAVVPVAPEVVRRQVAAVIADVPVTHVKIGMVGSAAIAEAIAAGLKGFDGEVIYDPVLAASTGASLTANGEFAAILDHLAPRITALTPNLDELEQISGRPCLSLKAAMAAGRGLFARFPRLEALVITGGHGADRTKVTDTLLLRNDGPPDIHHHPRIATNNTHGTGCTFASALTACHLHAGDYRTAFRKAAAFVHRLLATSAHFDSGHGTGGMAHFSICETTTGGETTAD